MKIVLASPPTRVTVSSAFARRAGSVTDTTTAKAGSYSTIEYATPSSTNTAYSSSGPVTRDQPSTARTPSAEPAVIRAWPPRRSSQRPTGIDIVPATSTAMVSAVAVAAGRIPRPVLIGPSSTPKA
jgi:hypothetical protein